MREVGHSLGRLSQTALASEALARSSAGRKMDFSRHADFACSALIILELR
jgi:hypothetical protein